MNLFQILFIYLYLIAFLKWQHEFSDQGFPWFLQILGKYHGEAILFQQIGDKILQATLQPLKNTSSLELYLNTVTDFSFYSPMTNALLGFLVTLTGFSIHQRFLDPVH